MIHFSRELYIGDRAVGPDHSVLVIAEAGVNHNGDVDLALKLVSAARRCGADCVKFQTFDADDLALPDAPKAPYQLETTDRSETQQEMLRKLQLDRDDYVRLIERCEEEGIIWLSTPYGPRDADFLAGLGVVAFKIASGQLVEPHFLTHVAAKGKPMIVSTGMATLEEVEAAVGLFRDSGITDVALMQCHTDYPSRVEDANLLAMAEMGRRFDVIVGYSDHTTTPTAATAAVALGARIIERHFTLDRSLPGPDQAASADPEGFTDYVKAIRDAEASLGDPRKKPSSTEVRNLINMRRSLVALRDIAQGILITEDLVGVKRPAAGLEPRMLLDVIGREAARDIPKDAPIQRNDVKW